MVVEAAISSRSSEEDFTILKTPTFGRGNYFGQGTANPYGDLTGRDHPTNIAIINNTIRQYAEASGIQEHLSFPYRNLPAEIQTRVDELVETTNAFREGVKPNFEINRRVANAYRQADELTTDTTPEIQAAARIAALGGAVHAVLDFDGTMTDPEKRSGIEYTSPDGTHNYLEILIPGSATAEDLLSKYGREPFTTVFAIAWQKTLEDAPWSFKQGGRFAPLREGVNELCDYLTEAAGKTTVVSANFKPFLEGALEQVSSSENIEVNAIIPHDLSSAEKDAVIFKMVQEEPTSPIIYFGDGGTDKIAIKASSDKPQDNTNPEDVANNTAFTLALQGGQFARELEEAGVLHFTFTNLKEAQQKVKQILELVPQVKAHYGIGS